MPLSVTLVKVIIIYIIFKGTQTNNKSKEKDAKIKEQKRRESTKNSRKKSTGDDQGDASLKGVDVRTLHEAYQLLMKKYCPEKNNPENKKKKGEGDNGPAT